MQIIPVKPLELLTNEELNYALPRFICEVRKSDGTYYPPNSLWQLIMGVQIYMGMNGGRPMRLLNDPNFTQVKNALDYTMKDRREKVLGVNVKQADIITREMENEMWEKGILGHEKPD